MEARTTKYSNLSSLLKAYWKDYSKIATNDIPSIINDAIDAVREAFICNRQWFEVYDFVDFMSLLSWEIVGPCSFSNERRSLKEGRCLRIALLASK